MARQVERHWLGTLLPRAAESPARDAYAPVPDDDAAPAAPARLKLVEPAVGPPTPALAPSPTARAVALLRRWRTLLTAIVLYLGSLLSLLVNLAWFPPIFYNWEEYTAWRLFRFLDRPTLAHFALNEGLMTDSGRSPLAAGPILLGWRIFGPNLLGTRLPIALIAALAVPLCWRVGRRCIGERPALLGAILLALSPVFILYGRTATLVGMSLAPALATIGVLLRVLERPTPGQVALLHGMFLVNSFAYSPIRFLWLIALGALGIETVLRTEVRARFAAALLVTALVLPLCLWGIACWDAHTRNEFVPPPLGDTVKRYYHGRGETVFGAGEKMPPIGDIVTYIGKNGIDSYALFLDIDTRPVIYDFWNPHGRLQPLLLVPFCVLGLTWMVLHARRRPEARLLLLLLAGFWLPLLFTNNVHAGRLIYVLPLLAIFTAAGGAVALDWLHRVILRRAIPAGRAPGESGRPGFGLRRGLAVLLVVAVAAGTWHDYTGPVPAENLARDVALLRGNAPQLASAGRVAVMLLAPEEPENDEIVVSGYRLRLEPYFRFIDLRAVPLRTLAAPGDARPPLIYAGDPTAVLNRDAACNAIYYTPNERVGEVMARVGALGCAELPAVIALPH